MDLQRVLDALLSGVRDAVGTDLIALHQVGSFALGAGDEASDVDFLAVLRADPSPDQLRLLRTLHAVLPDRPEAWARHLEGSYAPVEELRRPAPPGVERRGWWYVDNGHRELERSTHDDTLVVRWVLREHGVALTGPPGRDLVDPVTPDQLSEDAHRVLGLWDEDLRRRPDQFRTVLAQQQHVLGLCRLLHRARHGRVLSKPTAARWFLETGDPRWHALVTAAVEGRSQGWARAVQRTDELVVQETVAFHRDVLGAVGP